MIALLTCLGNLLESKAANTSYRGFNPPDSVLVSYEELRLANAKMIELKYQKVINDSLRSLVYATDQEVVLYKTALTEANETITKQHKELKKTNRKVKAYKGIAGGSILLMILGIVLL